MASVADVDAGGGTALFGSRAAAEISRTNTVAKSLEDAARSRRGHAQLLGWACVLGIPVAAFFVALAHGALKHWRTTSLTVTPAEAWWVAAWLLALLTVGVSALVRSQGTAPDTRDAALGNTTAGQNAVASATTADDITTALASLRTSRQQLTAATAAERGSGLRGLIVGADGRVSTSKLQATLWTYALLFAFLDLLLVGWHVIRHSCPPNSAKGTCPPVLAGYNSGFNKLITQELRPEYFVLLGLPIAAAIAAKALFQNKSINGQVAKTLSDKQGVLAGASEALTDDNGDVDLLDFQYVAFNALTLVYFFSVFFSTVVRNPANGLPAIPPTLLALSGVSAASYITKKGLEKSTMPDLYLSDPAVIILGRTDTITLAGNGFITDKPTARNTVTLGGIALAPCEAWTTTSVTVSLPADEKSAMALGLQAGTLDVVVTDSDGNASGPLPVRVELKSVVAPN